ncbi:MAG: hypothetical protein U9P00_03710 [Pseudomonadota bacterium]|nr:hypothetical protein [Pseudomonadota bacterium]
MAYSDQSLQFLDPSLGQTLEHRAEQDNHRTQVAFTAQEAH